MNDRIRKLRDQSLNAVYRISAERAILITEFYQSDLAQKVPTSSKRALAFKYIRANK
jgi:formate C-acetyltransferase